MNAIYGFHFYKQSKFKMEGDEVKRTRKSLQLEKLYDASLEGDITSLITLLQLDPFILDRCIIAKTSDFSQSPLHVAIKMGHLEFIKQVLHQKPELAEELDFSKGWSPLHLASSKGHLEIVRILSKLNPNMCFARDHDGRNPVHVAAVNGHVHVLKELLQTKLQAGRERTNCDETILHLCVKYSRFEALECLLDVMDAQLVNSRDCDGNTVLHLAVATKQFEIVGNILQKTCTEINALNNNGLTALDILSQSLKDSRTEEILGVLKQARALPAKKVLQKLQNDHHSWFNNQRNALMVVASLIATMAFQVGINPPGGLWQEDSKLHTAGTSVLATKAPGRYNVLLISNTLGFFSSFSVIILLVSGLPYRRLFMGILMFALWIAATATTSTYLLAVVLIFDFEFYKTKYFDATPTHWKTFYVALITWDCLMAFLLLRHTVRFIVKKRKQSEESWLNNCKR